MEHITKAQIKVREVTHVQASYTEPEQGQGGMFTLQLILDNGAEEYILQPTSSDADLVLKLFQASNNAHFDMERKVLMFGNLNVRD